MTINQVLRGGPDVKCDVHQWLGTRAACLGRCVGGRGGGLWIVAVSLILEFDVTFGVWIPCLVAVDAVF